MKHHLLSITNLSAKEITTLLSQAATIKKYPQRYRKKLTGKTLLTFFELPSLRTSVSFQVAMQQLGGHVIEHHASNSPFGKGKEGLEDVARVLDRYVDCVMMRLTHHYWIIGYAISSTNPVINGLTNREHPCQILSDLLTIKEKFGKLKGLTLAYYGDANNNVTNSLLLACSMMGINMTICCPKHKTYSPPADILKEARKGKSKITLTTDPAKGSIGADIVYTDSWMSYSIPTKEKNKRVKALFKYQVDEKVMAKANKKAIFMHCLPADKGYEVLGDVFDSKQSVVFDQAENRLHMQKAILLKMIK